MNAVLLALALTGIKLYPSLDFVPSRTCDLHEKLVIGKFEAELDTAYLKQDLTEPAACDVAPHPYGKSYRLTERSVDGCGSVYWKGGSWSQGKIDRIEIVDHRPRICDDLAPFVQVTEKYADGEQRVLYGKVEAPFSWRP